MESMPLRLGHVLQDDDFVFLRYVRGTPPDARAIEDARGIIR
jgi:hypothetical protein